MHIEVTQDQKQKYKEEGMVVIHDLIPEDLFAHIKTLSTGKNHFQRDRTLLRALTNRNVGQMLHQLTGERPIRLVLSEVINQGLVDYKRVPFQGLLVAIVIPFSENRSSIFAVNTDFNVEEKSIIALYGVNETLLVHSDKRADLLKMYRERGYDIGDKLRSIDSPFVYR